MKKTVLSLACMACIGLNAFADDLQKVDAKEVTKITFDGDNVILHYKDGSTTKTFDMGTVTIDFTATTGIDERLSKTMKAGIEGKSVYNLSGKYLGNSAARLNKGVYLIDGRKVIIK